MNPITPERLSKFYQHPIEGSNKIYKALNFDIHFQFYSIIWTFLKKTIWKFDIRGFWW